MLKAVEETMTLFESVDENGDHIVLSMSCKKTGITQMIVAHGEEEARKCREIAMDIARANGLKVFERKYHCISAREL